MTRPLRKLQIIFTIAVLAISNTGPMSIAEAKADGQDAPVTDRPLKVYILVGQSNMQGHAGESTIPAMALDPVSKALHDKIVDETGAPRVHENVSIVYFTGGGGKKGQPRTHSQKQGLLTTGFGHDMGPELAFGITMDEEVDAPILLIKAAWGGKNLYYDFRPPSAGSRPFQMKAQEWDKKVAAWKEAGTYDAEIAKLTEKMAADESCGWYYREMIERVKSVLADPGAYSEDYDPEQGYEIAGFVWFQGYNDWIAPYPMADGNRAKDYSEYSRLLACLIRDVRKELDAPKLPFVIGVMGVGGKPESRDTFREAMAAPAAMAEFKGTVTAVHTAPFWENAYDKVYGYAKRWGRSGDASYTRNADGTLDTSKPRKFGWSIIGTPAPGERQWRFTSFHVDKEKVYSGYLVNGGDSGRALEEVIPENLEGWYKPDFDDSDWQKGLAPIGKGEWDLGRGRFAKNKSTWGEGNILLMRTTFEVEDLDYLSYRLNVLGKESYHVYLNGQKIHSFPWWSGYEYRAKDRLGGALKKAIKKGTNVLAIYANSVHRDKDRYDVEAINSVDAFVDGETEKTEALVQKMKDKVFPPKYQKISEGISNKAYHYHGSAKIYSRIGEAMANALMNLDGAE